ncbi:MAG: DUF2716 domain-containing protein [Clostridia bacterium]|nr:DUF2716 domain-containing protein [Clostridia bacterium]
MILDKQRGREIWDWVYDVLDFTPYGGVDFVPFHIPFVHSIYDISQMLPEHMEKMDDLILSAFLNCTDQGERLYALDWQHSSFLFDPRADVEMEDIYVEDERYTGGGYYAYFPPFYPDGDYYFFLDEKLRFGYLSHPWRREVWIFGKALVEEFERIDRQLGWLKRSGADWRANG